MASQAELDQLRKELYQTIRNPVTGNMAGKIVSGIMMAANLSAGGATQQWVEDQNYVDSDELALALNPYATQDWVTGQNYLQSVNNNHWSGADLTIANGGTGASSASAARINLGLAIGLDVAAFNDSRIVNGQIAFGWGDHGVEGYLKAAQLAPVAFSNDYNDLINTPTIPTNNNQLTNGAGYITEASNATWGGGPLSIANGGTDATTAIGARINLGLAIGLDVAAYNDSRIVNGQTAFGWGDHGVEGYATQFWVTNQGFLTTANLTDEIDKPYIEALGISAASLTGTLPNARLSSNVALKNVVNTFTSSQIIDGGNLTIQGTEALSKIIFYRNYSTNQVGAEFLNSAGAIVIAFNANVGRITATEFLGSGANLTGVVAVNSDQLGGYDAVDYVLDTDLTSTLSGYVTNSSLTSTLSGYVTTGFLTLQDYTTLVEVAAQGYATESFVTSQGYLNISGVNSAIDTRVNKSFIDLLGINADQLGGYDAIDFVRDSELTSTLASYVTNSALTTTLADYATQAWVNLQGFLTTANLTAEIDKPYVESLGISASSLTGTLADARLSSNVALKNINNGFVSQTINGSLTLNDAVSQIILQAASVTSGSIYANQSNQVGFLDGQGNWAYRHSLDTSHEFLINDVVYFTINSSGVISGNGAGLTNVVASNATQLGGVDAVNYARADVAETFMAGLAVQGGDLAVTGADITTNGWMKTGTPTGGTAKKFKVGKIVTTDIMEFDDTKWLEIEIEGVGLVKVAIAKNSGPI